MLTPSASASVHLATLAFAALAAGCSGSSDTDTGSYQEDETFTNCMIGCDVIWGSDTCTGEIDEAWGDYTSIDDCYADCEVGYGSSWLQCAADVEESDNLCDAARANCGDGVTYSVDIAAGTPTEMVVGDTVTIAATTDVSNGSDSVLFWETSNAGIGTIDQQGRFRAIASGRVLITATLTGTADTNAPTSDTDTHEIVVTDGCADPEVLTSPVFEYGAIDSYPVTVGEGDCLTQTDSYARVFELVYDQDGGRQFELTGFEDRARMLLFDDEGNLLRDGSAAALGEPAVFRKQMDIGTYFLWVTTATPRTSTAMSLSVVDTCSNNTSSPAYLRQPRTGSFVDGDCFHSGKYRRDITFSLDDPDGNIRLTIDLGTAVPFWWDLRAQFYSEHGSANDFQQTGVTQIIHQDFLYDANYTLELESEEPVDYTVEFERY